MGPLVPCVKALARLGFRTILQPADAPGVRFEGPTPSMIAIAHLTNTVIGIYIFVLFVHVILSWLNAFNVVNARHPFVNGLGQITYRLCEPVLSKIRRFLPNLGGLDISPIILILLLYFARDLLNEYVFLPAMM
jgi:YggT family protein